METTTSGRRIRTGMRVTVTTRTHPSGIEGTVVRRATYRGRRLQSWVVDVGDGRIVVGASELE